jgi:FAD/FMN-containing dehydrogenase/Fe-S oxidoreductase
MATGRCPINAVVVTSHRDGVAEASRLAESLSRHIAGEVRFDAGSRALYSQGGGNYREVPIGVVVPRSTDDVLATLEICRGFGAPVLSRGGGTSLAGQCCNVAVVIDHSKYLDRILAIDEDQRRAQVEPGVVLDQLRASTVPRHLTFAPDPSTHSHCTLGGMIGNNSCGVHSVMAGRTSDNVEELDVVTYDGVRLTVGATSDVDLVRRCAEPGRVGQIYRGLRDIRDRHADLIRARYPKIPRRVSGYNLDDLLPEKGFQVARALTGTEGTCVTILRATVRLCPWPRARSLLVLGYPSVYEAADHVEEVMAAGPMGLEGIDDVLVNDMQTKQLHADYLQLLPQGKGWLLVEFGGDSKSESDDKARALMARLGHSGPKTKLYDDAAEEEHIWKVRESGLGATARIANRPDTWEGWEDSAVPPAKLGQYLRALRSLFERYRYGCALYGHFGQGCVHTRIDFDLKTTPGIEKFRAFIEDASDLVLSLGGSLSGEHGDGQSRAELLPKMFGPELVEAFADFKRLWDPEGRMNPGKIVRPNRITADLRFGARYRPQALRTYFSFSDDRHDFAYATERCVGVGECRRKDGGTMCPSYMVTGEEKHSTRGRARLLNEMVRGEVVSGQWGSDAVKDALDLCLACKGCKGDCPVNVDMATYKAEFLAHHYRHRLRPITAYTMGLIGTWARLASRMPRLVNLLTGAPVLGWLLKGLGGIHQRRKIPQFAPETFQAWWKRRPPRPSGGSPVVLWPDTFNNHFHPQVAIAAVEVLEAAGYQVKVPPQALCCGRPLYDYGFLDQARARLQAILRALRPEIEAGTPLVALEPSCLSVFRDELRNLMAGDLDAQRLGERSFLLTEFLDQAGWRPPMLAGKAVVHLHCHHKAIVREKSARAVLDGLGMEYDLLDSGCCGMAGAFGFERQHYDIAQRCGERKLLPAVRAASAETLLVTDGFSCREQIHQNTGRRTLHPAELLRLALGRAEEKPAPRRRRSPSAVWTGAFVGLALLGTFGGLWLRRRR